jgi:signal transduction histidine kinase
MQSRAAELHVALAWTPGCDLPQVLIDPDGIHRAVLNIVTNAIDAAENVEGACVTIATAYDAGNELAQITVADNGVGISESDLASIFQVFASTKGARGTGLGLPVSQKIVREHGGKIVVTSKPGQGSQFVVELPMRRTEPGKGSGGTREVPIAPG